MSQGSAAAKIYNAIVFWAKFSTLSWAVLTLIRPSLELPLQLSGKIRVNKLKNPGFGPCQVKIENVWS